MNGYWLTLLLSWAMCVGWHLLLASCCGWRVVWHSSGETDDRSTGCTSLHVIVTLHSSTTAQQVALIHHSFISVAPLVYGCST